MPKNFVKRGKTSGRKKTEADEIDQRIAMMRFERPAITIGEMARELGLNPATVSRRLQTDFYKDAVRAMNESVFERIADAQRVSMENMMKFLVEKNAEGELSSRAFEASRIFMVPLASSPAALPAPPADGPEFIDPKAES